MGSREVIHSLTHARMLVRTKAQNKIDARICLLFERKSFDVWVKECGSIVCKPMERARTKYDTLNLKPTDKQSVSPVSASKGYVSDSVNALDVRNNDIRVFLDISDVNQIVSNPDALVSGMINRTNDSLAMNRMDPCDLDE